MRGKKPAFEVVRLNRKGTKAKGHLWADMPGFDAAMEEQRRSAEPASADDTQAEPTEPQPAAREKSRTGRVLADRSVREEPALQVEPVKRRGRPRKTLATTSPEETAVIEESVAVSPADEPAMPDVEEMLPIDLPTPEAAGRPSHPSVRDRMGALRRHARFPPGKRWMRHLPRWSKKARGR